MTGATDVAVIGTAASVIAKLRAYADAGATDLVLSPVSTVATRRLWEVAANL